MSKPTKSDVACAARMLLVGNVQGIGYRPALARLAQACGIRGWVRNAATGVEAHLEGTPESLARFIENCEAACPENGWVDAKQVNVAAPSETEAFSILPASSVEPTATVVPRDRVACSDCLAEVADPGARRHGYLLTACSSCGPRYTIIERMPFEREHTAMSGFPLCRDCLEEYQSPAERRFHAQSIACADCGPVVTGLECALDCLARGNVLAIKGIGGYQLLVDANNPTAIERLRQRKRRPSKPLAIMVADCASAGAFAELDEAERQLLSSSPGPIVVVRLRRGALPASVAPNLVTVGVMLATSPLHAWLAQSHGPLVVTSGNVEGQPLAYEPGAAHRELAAVADHFVDHDRPIVRAIDDSVTRVIARRPATLRLARGLAPLPLQATLEPTALQRLPHVLALGAHQKAAIALCNGRQAILGPHIGDLDTLETRERFVAHVGDMCKLYGVRPTVLVHDHHADYFSSRWGEEYCRETRARRMSVQHHHAHIAAGMVQQGWLGREVLGVAWDGTGLGSDGTLWGGEFLIATACRFERTACLRPLALPGGEAAIRQPWRSAAAMLHELRGWDASLTYRLPGQELIDRIAAHPQFSPPSTSIGRLFDAVAALVLPDLEIRMSTSGYEGHFAAMLEELCNTHAQGSYPFPVVAPERSATADPFRREGEPRDAQHHRRDAQTARRQILALDRSPAGMPLASIGQASRRPYMLDWRPLVRSILADLDAEVPRADIAMRFHRSLAAAIRQISYLHRELPIVLGGGVFQNKLLVELVQEQLADCMLALPGEIPVGDGGLAAGQLAIACAQLEQESCA